MGHEIPTLAADVRMTAHADIVREYTLHEIYAEAFQGGQT